MTVINVARFANWKPDPLRLTVPTVVTVVISALLTLSRQGEAMVNISFLDKSDINYTLEPLTMQVVVCLCNKKNLTEVFIKSTTTILIDLYCIMMFPC